jgi:hypothetical protein
MPASERAVKHVSMPHRRDVLKLCGSFVLAGALSNEQRGAIAASEQANIPMPCAPEAWTKHGVVIPPTEPWELNEIQNFNSNTELLPDNRWRIWYGVNHPDARSGRKTVAIAEGEIGGAFKKTQAVISEGEPEDAPLAIGNMPGGWQPVQPVHIHMKNGKHRLYFWVHSGRDGVQRFIAADSDDGRRYRVVNAIHPCLITFYDRAHPNIDPVQGTRWGLRGKLPSRRSRPADEPLVSDDQITNDGATVYQHADGSFEMYAQSLVTIDQADPRFLAHDNLAGHVRVIDRFVSEDGLRWEQRTRVLQPDEKDSIDTQFYHLTVTHTDRGLVGLLGHYYVKDQFMHLEWCYSKDGLKWDRPLRREWVKRGPPGTPDSYIIYPGRDIVERDGRWYFFYTGNNYSHNTLHSHGKPQGVIMLASTPSIWAS